MFFQLDDIKHRRSPYYDYSNLNSFATPPDSTLRWNLTRGLIVGNLASIAQALLNNFRESAKAVLSVYQPPANAKQSIKMFNLIRSLDHYKFGLRNSLNYGIAFGSLSIAPKLAMFRWIDGGWHNVYGGFNYTFLARVPGLILISMLSAPLTTAVAMANHAYQSDLTFPKELRRGYSSVFDALWKIPRENGIYYLFKNTSPLLIGDIVLTTVTFTHHHFIRDVLSLMHRRGDMSTTLTSAVSAAISTVIGLTLAFPIMVKTREIVDFLPVRGKFHPFDNNYRKVMAFMYRAFSMNMFYNGFSKFMWEKGPQTFLMVLLADKMGMFTHWRVNFLGGAGDNSWEDAVI